MGHKAPTYYSDTTLDPAPEDGVTRVAFNAESTNILFSTWAGTLRVHGVSDGALRYEAKRHSSALLDCAWESNDGSSSLLACSLDGRVLRATCSESTVNKWTEVGRHDDSLAARSLVPSVGTSASLTVTGGWDKNIMLWDTRQAGAGSSSSSSSSSPCTAKIDAGAKVYGAAACGSECAIFITSDRHVRVLDVRKTNEFVHDRIPPTLAYQLRGISALHDGSQYVVGGTDGRVAVDWLDNSGKDAFSYKCHRVDNLAFPVNCVAHNKRYGSFATGGGDGHVAIWDGEARKRITQFGRFSTSIASIDFDSQSELMGIAVSYTFEEGEKDHPSDEIIIRSIDDAQIATRRSKQDLHEK